MRNPSFADDFKSALTALVHAEESPQSLSLLSQGAIDIVNEHKDILPDIMKKVQMKESETLKRLCLVFH